jgi:hypothetical protein
MLAGLSPHRSSLLPVREALSLHNRTELAGDDLSFVSDPAQWSYSVSFPVVVPRSADPELQSVLSVDVEVLEGRVGVGVVDRERLEFVTTEVDADARQNSARIELELGAFEGEAHVMVRNTAPDGVPSCFRLLAASLDLTRSDGRLLSSVEVPAIRAQVYGTPPLSATFDVLVSHSSRHWNAADCDRDYLRGRYDTPDRLRNPPPFESLPPNDAPYHGLLSVLRLRVSPGEVTSSIIRHYKSAEKVVHAAIVGDRIVVCFDAGLAHFPYRRDVGEIDLTSPTAQRMADPWLGGMHTVAAVDERTCVVSSAGADAILWLNVHENEAVRRWRLPAERYGTNYALDETTWLSEHYIPNKLQLGHLNSAAPDGRGRTCFSVLGQGDVGYVDAAGNYEVLVSGYVGCHGARYRGDELYFSDSCSGRLMRVDGPDRASVLFETGSRWLQDAAHLTGDLFLLALADRNQLVLADVGRRVRLAEWDFGAVQGTVQFLNVAAAGP